MEIKGHTLSLSNVKVGELIDVKKQQAEIRNWVATVDDLLKLDIDYKKIAKLKKEDREQILSDLKEISEELNNLYGEFNEGYITFLIGMINSMIGYEK